MAAEIKEVSEAERAIILRNIKTTAQYKAIVQARKEEKAERAANELLLQEHRAWVAKSAHVKIVNKLDLSSFVEEKQ